MHPEPDDIHDITQQLADTLHRIAELHKPIFEAADGVRAELERRGWSPTISEELGAEYLTLCMRRLFHELAEDD